MGRRYWFIPRVDGSQPANPLAGFPTRQVRSPRRLLHKARRGTGRIESSHSRTEELAQPGRHESSKLNAAPDLTLSEVGCCQSDGVRRDFLASQRRQSPDHLPERAVAEFHPTRAGLFEVDLGRSEREGAVAAIGGKPDLAGLPAPWSDAELGNYIGSMLDQLATE